MAVETKTKIKPEHRDYNLTGVWETLNDHLPDAADKDALQAVWAAHAPETSPIRRVPRPAGPYDDTPADKAARYAQRDFLAAYPDTMGWLPERLSVATCVYNQQSRRRITATDVQRHVYLTFRGTIRNLYGSYYNKRKGINRPGYIGFVERVSSNIHAHVLCYFPEHDKDVQSVMNDEWKTVVNRGNIRIDPCYGSAGWINYIQKEQFGETLREAATLLFSA